PVVRAVHAELVPDVAHAQADGLARDALAVQVRSPDEDARLAVAGDPVDVEEAGESDGLALRFDRPVHRVRVVAVPFEALLDLLGGRRGEARAPEARRLRDELPLREEVVVLAYARPQHGALTPADPGSA